MSICATNSQHTWHATLELGVHLPREATNEPTSLNQQQLRKVHNHQGSHAEVRRQLPLLQHCWPYVDQVPKRLRDAAKDTYTKTQQRPQQVNNNGQNQTDKPRYNSKYSLLSQLFHLRTSVLNCGEPHGCGAVTKRNIISQLFCNSNQDFVTEPSGTAKSVNFEILTCSEFW